MTRRSAQLLRLLLPLLIVVACLHRLDAQQDKVAALKQSLAANQKKLAQYKWVETTVVSMKGEEKSRAQKQCFYGPDGKVQKQPLSAPPQQAAPGGMKGKIVAKKKEEISEYMKQAVELIHQYVPPDPQRIQAVKGAGGLAISPTGPGAVRAELKNYLKPGDTLSLGLDTASNSILTVNVRTYLESQSDAISLDVTFAKLSDGVSYPGNIVLNAPGKQIQVVIQNSNYLSLAPAAQPPAQTSAAGAASQAIDAVTAPIALYPDALIAQILTASTDFPALQKFSGWMGANANLKGSDLQDAAQKEGFAAAYIALAPFPQVIQMLVQKPDWTQQLGKAFTADKTAVFDSIQRLRAQAQAVGNLKTTEQQQVQAQTTSTGQQVIVIQPANPQVIYVPQYNPQTVYVQAPPPAQPNAAAAAMIGFTAGVIIGHNSSVYYHGPYAWHGAAMYNDAWNHAEHYQDQRQENYQQNSSQRQSASQANQTQRQDASQANQAQRQAAASGGQAQAQANQAQRQSAASSGQAQAQANQAQRQSAASSGQAQAQANQAQRQSAASTSSYGGGQAASQRSGGGGGYQSGASARAQSARGSRSTSGSRGGRSR